MGYCLFWSGWELKFRTYLLWDFASCFFFFLSSLSPKCFQTVLQMTFTPLSRNWILFFCPSPFLAFILSLPKPKLMKWSYLSILSFWNFLPRIILLVPPCILRVKLISLQGIAQCLSWCFVSCFLSTSTFSLCCLKCVLTFCIHTSLCLQYGTHTCKKHLKTIFCHYSLSPSYHLFYCELLFGNCMCVMALLCTYGLKEKCARQEVKKERIYMVLHMPSLLSRF